MRRSFNLNTILGRKTRARSLSSDFYLSKLDDQKRAELFHLYETDGVMQMLKGTKLGRVAYLNDNQNPLLLKKIAAADPKTLINLVYDHHSQSQSHLGYFTALANLHALPLRQGQIDLVVCPFSLIQTKLEKVLKQLSATLPNGSRMILSVVHPQFEFILKRENPNNEIAQSNRLSLYHQWLKQNHMYVEDLVEMTIDQKAKPFFVDEEGHDFYYHYRGVPLLLQFKAVKYQR